LRSLRRDAATPAALSQMRGSLFARLENPHAILGWRIRLERFLLAGVPKPRYALAGVAIVTIVSLTLFAQMRHVSAGPVVVAAMFEGESTLLRPDYREWKVVDPTAHERQHVFQKAYIQPHAYQEFTQTGKFPEGTVLILDSGTPSGSVLASVKDRRFEGGWGYFEFTNKGGRQPSKSEPLPKTAGCFACHRDRAATDHVFTQFYPVLRTAAGVL